MASNSIIRSYLKPAIELEEMSTPDVNYGSDPTGVPKKDVNKQADLGKNAPLLKVNGVEFQVNEIERFNLDCKEFIPTMSVVLSPSSADLLSNKMPMDGDLIQLFIRSNSKVIKPIRCDFVITNVNTYGNQNQELVGVKISVEGRLNVPHLYDEVTMSLKKTSYEALKDLAADLKLGFSSNIESTDDEMNWICSFKTKEEFIKDIVDASWKDENSFFTAFIDVYYNLNFIEVNSQLNFEGEGMLGEVGNPFNNNFTDLEIETSDTTQKRLTNQQQTLGTNFGISKYKPMNRASEISKTFGYIYKMKMFDYSSMSPFDFSIEPMVAENAASTKMTLKGKAHDDSYKDQAKTNFVGIQYTDNVHEMFYYAKVHNMMNNLETEKMTLDVTLSMPNLNFIRYDSVPVMIFTGTISQSDAGRINKYKNDDQTGEDSDNAASVKPTMDRFYSGNYVLKGYTITYENNGAPMAQNMVLTKREWNNQYC